MKRRASTNAPKDGLTVTPLGAGQEVGRSCIVLKFKGKQIMLDCGIHPAYNGIAALPFFDEIDPAAIDVLLISHFHLDHAASLPYFMQKTSFRGRVYMTHPTKAIYKWLLSDYVRVSTVSVDDMLYTEADLVDSFERIEAIDYHQTVDVGGIKFTAYNAGHVLGAAMFVLEIAGVKILYTGDYSREEDRHLMAAERPPGLTPDIMICESTYGVQSNEPRQARESRFTGLVHEVVARGGRCLIPAFALGRAQELLLILDEYWQSRPDLHRFPIYYASALAKKCMAVYQTYVGMMNARIKKQFASGHNPFVFKHISNLRGIEQFDDSGPCVMLASPAMLQSGLSRQLFDKWCTDRKNGVIIPGYVVDGTLAKSILLQPDEVVDLDGRRQPLRLKVEYISFSAHVDYAQNSAFIDEMKPINLILVHGEANEMMRLKHALVDKHSGENSRGMRIYSPRNTESVQLYFKGEKMAKTIGQMASDPPKDSQLLSGILIGQNFQYHLMSGDDLAEFTDVKATPIMQRQCIAYNGTFDLLRYHIEQMFGPLKSRSNMRSTSIQEEGVSVIRVLDAVDVRQHTQGQLLLEWQGDSLNDIVADAVIAVIFKIESHPVSIKLTKSSHSHTHGDSTAAHDDNKEKKISFVETCLKAHFAKSDDDKESVVMDMDKLTCQLTVDELTATIDLQTLAVQCEIEDFKSQIVGVLQEVMLTLMPIGELWHL